MPELEKPYDISKRRFNKTKHLSSISSVSYVEAAGSDQIQNIIFKNLSKHAIVQLTYIMNAIFKLSHFSQRWIVAHIIPIQKSGKPENKASSYGLMSFFYLS